MKKKVLLIITCYLFVFPSFSQEVESHIANEICTKLSNIDLNRHPHAVNNKAAEILQKAFRANKKSINKLYRQYGEIHKEASSEEVRQLVGQEIMFFLMKDCEYYQRITMFNNEPVPTISETTIKIGEAFTELLIKKSKNRKIDEALVDECIAEVSIEHYDLIANSFGDWSSPVFAQEFQAYLMTKCIPYIRWTASLVR